MKTYKGSEFFLRQRACAALSVLLLIWFLQFRVIFSDIFGNALETVSVIANSMIIGAVLWFVWERRFLLARVTFSCSQMALLLLLGVCSFYILGDVFHFYYLKLSAVILMIPSIVLLSCGSTVTRILWIPLLYLMFIIPLSTLETSYVWGILGSAFILFILYVWKLRKYEVVQDVLLFSIGWARERYLWFIPTILATCILCATPWLGENIRSFYPKQVKQIILKVPFGIRGWSGPFTVEGSSWTPRFPNASAETQAEYRYSAHRDDPGIYFYSAYYDSNRSWSDLFDKKNTPFDSERWAVDKTGIYRVKLFTEPFMVLEKIVKSGKTTRMIWYWYFIVGVDTIDTKTIKTLDKVRFVSKYAPGSGIMLLSTVVGDDIPKARERLQEFMITMKKGIDSLKRPE